MGGSDLDCIGGRADLSVSLPVILRVHYGYIAYESRDFHDDCDSITGDSHIKEYSAMVGLPLGARSGFFVAGGVSRVEFSTEEIGPAGWDTGSRFELGWNTALMGVRPAGFEISVARNFNGFSHYTVLGLGVLFGGRR